MCYCIIMQRSFTILIQWWNSRNKSTWYAEQYEVPTPVSEFMFHEVDLRSYFSKTRNHIGGHLMEIWEWDTYRLSPYPSPVMGPILR